MLQRLSSAVVLAIVVIAAAGVAAQENGGLEDAPTPVVVAPVRSEQVVDRVEALGTTRANESVTITANVTEKIAEIHFQDGQHVAKGDVLVVLDKAEEDAELQAALAILDEKRLAYERSLQLEKRQFTATAQLDERRAALREAEARITALEARVDDRVIRAPFSGVIGLRTVSVGTLVEPGDVITTLDDLSVIKLDFSVPSAYLRALAPGLGVVATSAPFGDQRFEGEVEGIDTRIDPVTRSIVVRAMLPNPNSLLKPGLLMTVELLKDPRQAMFIPEEALIPRRASNQVLVVDEAAENTVVSRDVTIGVRRPGRVEIVDGLREGDKVITRGTLQVRPGQRVSILAVDEGDTPLPQLLRGPEAAAGDGAS
ncbi:MAG: efflux RND transporter periplasmic adaptor subunit [Rhodospirillales bacterium]|nr:efflux RND transporter periplasmic adaptor subunit [Rhodospirillales bacterium]